ncbi:transglutaminase family protein [Streptomyces sp. 4N509B]|uniref:transglutaminase family protein n=1 Tax=Streptomyces sp. 4N509B TaxID=3457413 RepID=UPI003FD28659
MSYTGYAAGEAAGRQTYQGPPPGQAAGPAGLGAAGPAGFGQAGSGQAGPGPAGPGHAGHATGQAGGLGSTMDSRIRVALAAWLATLAAAAALRPLVQDAEWLLQVALLLGGQTATGALVRWRGVPAPVTVVAQALVSLVLLTVVTVPEYAVGGLFPGPAAFDRFGELLSSGANDINEYVVPAPVTDGIRLMLLGGVLLVGLVVDTLAVTLRSAASAGLPLLALYSVAAGVGQDETTWPYFVCAAAGYLVLLLDEGRDRLTRWGRFFAGPAPTAPSAAGYAAAAGYPGHGGYGGYQGAGAPPPPTAPPAPAAASGPRIRTGRRVGVVTLAVAAVTPLLLPSLGDGLLGLNADGTGQGGIGGGVAVNPVVGLQNQLNQPANRPVLRYRTTSSIPDDLYLRLVALDRFDGEEWTSSRWHDDAPPTPPWPVPGLAPEVNTSTAVTTISTSEDYVQSSLPVPYPAVWVDSGGDWDFDRGSQTLVSNTSLTSAGLRYEVEHLQVGPTEEQLTNAPQTSDEDFLEHYTEVPGDLPDEVATTAAEIVAEAGATNDFERARALEQWFTQDGGFRYDTTVDSGSGVDAIVRFLQQREGFCVHFAFSMAAMARTLDIPAQVAVGFTPGEQQEDGSFQVGIHNAHAWPELYFEGVGWVRFEPTPGQGNPPPWSSPDWTAPEPDEPEEDPEATGPEQSASPEEPSSSPTTGPSDGASETAGCDPVREPEACRGPGGTARDEDDGLSLPLVPMAYGGGGLLLAGLLASPMLWRRRLRARRLVAASRAATAGGPTPAWGQRSPGGGSVALPVWEELNDVAWDFGITPLVTETPRQTAWRVVRVAGIADEPAAAVHRVADAVERELYAPPGAGPGGGEPGAEALTADLRVAVEALRATAGRGARLRAALLPRSTVRVLNAATERRVRAAQRLSAALQRVLRRVRRRSA